MQKQLKKRKFHKRIMKEIGFFLEAHDIKTFSRRIRQNFLDYLQAQIDIGLPLYMKDFIWQLSDFFELMDLIEDESNES